MLEDNWKKWNTSQAKPDYDELFKSAQPVIRTAIQTYAGAKASPTIQNRAELMAHDAIHSFDPSRGASLKSHLMIQMRPLSRYSARVANPIHIPEKRIENLFKLHDTEIELEDKLGRSPTEAELMDHLGISATMLKNLRKSEIRTIQPVVDPESGYEYAPVTMESSEEDIWIDYVYHDMDPTSKKIMEWKLGLYGRPKLSNQEIAKKLRLTPSAVSQRTNRIIERLSEFNALPGGLG